jgi:TRAP-type uncharacterized transport system substrate-binding protein
MARFSFTALREYTSTAAPFIVFGIALLLLAYKILDPTPPRRVTLATGVAQGAYAQFGARYADVLAQHGITVELRATQGAAENIALLRRREVDLAFVQGGADVPHEPGQDPNAGLESLGNMFLEPVWLFYREDSARRLLNGPVLTSLAQLPGWRVNLGTPGSGVPNLMARLLEANAIDPQALTLGQEPLTPAVVNLLESRIDAVVLVSAPESLMVQMLLRTPGIRLFDFAQAEAYARRLPFLTSAVLPRGVVDLARDQPPADVRLIAPTASLVAHDKLHPALVQLFVQAARQVHGEAGWFQRKGEYPNAREGERPLSAEAQRYYRSGTPWLQRYLPFWIANLVDRMWIALLSIVAVLIPLSRIVPPLVDLRIRSRVFRWYGRLRAIETETARPADERLQELAEIEGKLEDVKLPLSYADELYALRGHIQMVRRRLKEE